MLHVGMRVNDNNNPNWADKVSYVNFMKCSNNPCSLSYILKSKELDLKKEKSAHEVISGSNHPS